jgi:hypothetical protein
VCVLLGIQLLDLTGRFNLLREKISAEDLPIMNYEKWDEFLGRSRVKTVYFYPKFKCETRPFQGLLAIMRYAADRGLNLNTGYIARYTPDCSDAVREIKASDSESSAYVFAQAHVSALDDVKKYFPETMVVTCAEIDFAFVCKASLEEGQR